MLNPCGRPPGEGPPGASPCGDCILRALAGGDMQKRNDDSLH